jgi:hypothetical protein
MSKQVNPSPVGALKLKDAAKYCSLSPISIHRAIKRGLLKPNRAFRHLIFPVAELDRFLTKEGQE